MTMINTDLLKMYNTIETLILENAHLKSTLHFYADRKNWFEEMGISSPIEMDQGHQARDAIKAAQTIYE